MKPRTKAVAGDRAWAGCIFLALALAQSISRPAGAAQLPDAPSRPWRSPALHLPTPAAENLPQGFGDQALSLAALIDLAEQRNPETRVAWDEARSALAAKNIARSALLPTLTGLVLSQTIRDGVLFDSTFYRQTEGIVEPALELDYTVFDWNGRLDALRAARFDLLASDFAFNNTHLQVMEQVASSYYRLLNAQGQVTAAQANLQNARTVADQVNARLAQGLATLPDALEARAQAAQAAYSLVSLEGSQSIAQADLATTLRLPASTFLPVIPYDRLAPPPALSESAAEATAVALADRPDLLQQEATVAAANQRIRQATTAYYPQIVLTGQAGELRAYGQQDLLSPVYGTLGVWNAQLNLRWTLFDGGNRSNQVARAVAERAAAQARLDVERDQIEAQVWTAYTNSQTAFAQQQAAESLLNASQLSYNAAVEAYSDGVRTIVDVVTAERELAQARSEEVTARTNVFQQTTALAFRTGELLRSHAGPRLLPPGAASPSAQNTGPQHASSTGPQ